MTPQPHQPKSSKGWAKPARQNLLRAITAYRQKGEAGLRRELLRIHPPLQKQPPQPPDPQLVDQTDQNSGLPAPPPIVSPSF